MKRNEVQKSVRLFHRGASSLYRRSRRIPALESVESRILCAASPAVTEFRLPPLDAQPTAITTGPGDGNLWSTETNANKIAKITPAGLVTDYGGLTGGALPTGITAGKDGNLWFTEPGTNRIGQMSAAGVLQKEFSDGITANSGPSGIAQGPGTSLWFTEPGTDKIAQIAFDGKVTEYDIKLASGSRLTSIVLGPDNFLWFTEPGSNKIGRLNPSDGSLANEYTTGITAGSQPTGLTVGPDGNIWFTEPGGNRVAKITMSGAVTEYSTGISANAQPTGISAGPGGTLWFTEPGLSRVARITTSGVVTEYASGITPSSQPLGITLGPDGNVWFTEHAASQVARLVPNNLIQVNATPLLATAGVPFSGVVATFTSAAPNAQPGDFTATIDFGDGQVRQGAIQANGAGGFNVIGTNTYSAANTYTVRVQVSDSAGVTASSSTSAIVGTLTGHLDPLTDSGPSNTDGVTNVDRPRFLGTAAPYAVIQVYAQLNGSVPTELLTLGQAIAGPDGTWSLNSRTLQDGVYTITASMVPQAGSPTVPVPLLPNPLVIDTSAPRVTTLSFSQQTGTITVVFQDALSGLYLPSLSNPSNYVVTFPHKLRGQSFTLQSGTPSAISGFYTSAFAESIVIGGTHPVPMGRYGFKILSAGIIDRAGNALDGEFTGRVPSGNGVAGGDFVASLSAHRQRATKVRPTRFRHR